MDIVEVFGGDLERHLELRILITYRAGEYLQERYAAQDLALDDSSD